MFKARYKINGFVKGTFESPSTNATNIAEYQHFAIYTHVILDGPVDLSSEALRIAFVPIFTFLHTYTEILRIPCLTLTCSKATEAQNLEASRGPQDRGPQDL